MRPRDVVKLCYQACFGAGHLLSDADGAREFLLREYADTAAEPGELFEPLPGGFARLNLGVAKREGIAPELIFRLFAATAELPPPDGAAERFRGLLALSSQFAGEGVFAFTRGEFDEYAASCTGVVEIPPPVSHSAEYRAAYGPRYRVVDARFMPLIGLCAAIHNLPGQKRSVVALDGRCASGKSTAAALLVRAFGAEIVRCDDFYLPPALRTPERYAQPGGNIHYERFQAEVVDKLPSGEPFEYGVFDCAEGRITRTARVNASPFLIVEGAYSTHPRFGRYYDLSAFFDVDTATQRERVTARDGADAWQSFERRWIPLEEAYIAATGAIRRADIVVR